MNDLIKMVFLLCMAGILSTGLSGCNNDKKDSTETKEERNEKEFDDKSNVKDSELVVDMVEENYAEIKMVQLAKERSTSTDVKKLANYLETQHKEVLNELKDLAGKRGITIPREEGAKSKDRIKVLSDIKAREFDKKWCKELMDKHEKSINKLESVEIADPDLKEWVAELLPKLRIHHDRLMQFHNKLK
jgi:putative membrane protein